MHTTRRRPREVSLAGLHGTARDAVDAITAGSLAALRDSAAGRLLQPARYGGSALHTDEFVTAVCEVAAADCALGWLMAMYNVAAAEIMRLPRPAVDEVWKPDATTLVAGSHAAGGQLVDGNRLSGRWQSVVGAQHADWLLLTARREEERCRVLLPRDALQIGPVHTRFSLTAAGVCDVSASDVPVDERRITQTRDGVLAAAGAAAAVVGSTDGVWRKHVEQVRARLATSYGGDEVTDEASAQVAWAASDIDAARLQITTALRGADDPQSVRWACRQAVTRARDAADRLLGSSRHALNASDPVTRLWQDVHAGCRLTGRLFDDLDAAQSDANAGNVPSAPGR